MLRFEIEVRNGTNWRICFSIVGCDYGCNRLGKVNAAARIDDRPHSFNFGQAFGGNFTDKFFAALRFFMIIERNQLGTFFERCAQRGGKRAFECENTNSLRWKNGEVERFEFAFSQCVL